MSGKTRKDGSPGQGLAQTKPRLTLWPPAESSWPPEEPWDAEHYFTRPWPDEPEDELDGEWWGVFVTATEAAAINRGTILYRVLSATGRVLDTFGQEAAAIAAMNLWRQATAVVTDNRIVARKSAVAGIARAA